RRQLADNITHFADNFYPSISFSVENARTRSTVQTQAMTDTDGIFLRPNINQTNQESKIDRKPLNLKNYSHSHPTMYLPMHKQQNTLTAQSRPISAMTNKDIGRSPKKFSGRLNSPTISRHSADSSPAALRQSENDRAGQAKKKCRPFGWRCFMLFSVPVLLRLRIFLIRVAALVAWLACCCQSYACPFFFSVVRT
ncbi:hypothetical protein NX88_11240, partial [Neisseria meningitidis]